MNECDEMRQYLDDLKWELNRLARKQMSEKLWGSEKEAYQYLRRERIPEIERRLEKMECTKEKR